METENVPECSNVSMRSPRTNRTLYCNELSDTCPSKFKRDQHGTIQDTLSTNKHILALENKTITNSTENTIYDRIHSATTIRTYTLYEPHTYN